MQVDSLIVESWIIVRCPETWGTYLGRYNCLSPISYGERGSPVRVQILVQYDHSTFGINSTQAPFFRLSFFFNVASRVLFVAGGWIGVK